MSAVLVFIEGIITFISPCILPMLPIYLLYLAGGGQKNSKRLIINTLGFVLGFTLIFTLLGASASWLGSILDSHRLLLQRVSGVVMILFGLHFIGVIKIKFLNAEKTVAVKTEGLKFLSSMVFGAAFSFGWTPCLGPFLGSALMLAANAATLWQGIGLLLLFSLGLGIPFVLTALIFNQLKGVFDFIKKHYRAVNILSGGLLIVAGFMMLFDLFGYYTGIFT